MMVTLFKMTKMNELVLPWIPHSLKVADWYNKASSFRATVVGIIQNDVYT
jgi:hypothetical protein